jgi:hypothetical protein
MLLGILSFSARNTDTVHGAGQDVEHAAVR